MNCTDPKYVNYTKDCKLCPFANISKCLNCTDPIYKNYSQNCTLCPFTNTNNTKCCSNPLYFAANTVICAPPPVPVNNCTTNPLLIECKNCSDPSYAYYSNCSVCPKNKNCPVNCDYPEYFEDCAPCPNCTACEKCE